MRSAFLATTLTVYSGLGITLSYAVLHNMWLGLWQDRTANMNKSFSATATRVREFHLAVS